MPNDLRDKGIAIANEAVEADNALRYEEAISKYVKAAEYLLTATKYEKNPVTLKTIREKCAADDHAPAAAAACLVRVASERSEPHEPPASAPRSHSRWRVTKRGTRWKKVLSTSKRTARSKSARTQRRAEPPNGGPSGACAAARHGGPTGAGRDARTHIRPCCARPLRARRAGCSPRSARGWPRAARARPSDRVARRRWPGRTSCGGRGARPRSARCAPRAASAPNRWRRAARTTNRRRR